VYTTIRRPTWKNTVASTSLINKGYAESTISESSSQSSYTIPYVLVRKYPHGYGLEPWRIQDADMSFPDLKPGSGLTVQPVQPAHPSVLVKSPERPRLFLTTVRIPDDHIWANGLFQNVYVIYKMLEINGYEPYLLVDNNANNGDAKIHSKFRMMDFKEYIQAPFQVIAYIEMGMSCDPGIRKFFRGMGAKVAKLYLGNILNIDTETPVFYPGMNFSHHVIGETDEIWTSPHYYMHLDYAACLNHVEPVEGVSARIAPSDCIRAGLPAGR
jgi:hypothetical protein